MFFPKMIEWLKSLKKINSTKSEEYKRKTEDTEESTEEKTEEKTEESTKESTKEGTKESTEENTEESTEESTWEHKQQIKKIGEAGERISNFKTLPIVTYGKQLRNLYIPTWNNKTTEIDTVIISVSGIYAIETKNYNGKIYGHEEQTNWTVWYSDSKKFSFYNPIKQNKTHLNALKLILDKVNNDCFFSIIVFGNNSDIQKIQYDKTQSEIIKQKDLLDKFKKTLTTNEGKLSRKEVNEIFEKLRKFANADEEVKEKHIDYVNSRKANNRKVQAIGQTLN